MEDEDMKSRGWGTNYPRGGSESPLKQNATWYTMHAVARNRQHPAARGEVPSGRKRATLIRAPVVKVTDPRLLPEHAGEQGPPVTRVKTEAGLSVIVVRLVFAANVPAS